jgi:hypothetical protein
LSFFLQELLCKLSIFFTHRLASTKAYQKKKIKVGVVILKIIDDVIIRRRKAVNISKVGTEEYALFKNKVNLFEDFSGK